MPTSRSDHPVYLKIREVRSRYLGYPSTFEASLRRFRGFNQGGVWDTLGTTRGHPDALTAQAYGLRMADRRGIPVENDPRQGKDVNKLVRQAEFRATYGEDA